MIIRRRRAVATLLGASLLTGLMSLAPGLGGLAWAAICLVLLAIGYLAAVARLRRLADEHEMDQTFAGFRTTADWDAYLGELSPARVVVMPDAGDPSPCGTRGGRASSRQEAQVGGLELLRFAALSALGWVLTPLASVISWGRLADLEHAGLLRGLMQLQRLGRSQSLRLLVVSAAAGASATVAVAAMPATAGASPAPGPSTPASAVAHGPAYRVQPGDTLWSLAEHDGTTVAALAATNHLADPNLIYAGQALVIDGDGAAPTTSAAPPTTPAPAPAAATAPAPASAAPAPAPATPAPAPGAPAPASAPATPAEGAAPAAPASAAPAAAAAPASAAAPAEGAPAPAPVAATPAPAAAPSPAPSDTDADAAAAPSRPPTAPAPAPSAEDGGAAPTPTAAPAAPASAPAPAAPATTTAAAPAAAPGSAQATAVHVALQQVGKPYQWGGSGPGSFDCSGLVMYAYAAAGVQLPHYTVSQFNDTTRISQAQLEPGDLVFYLTGGGAQPGHVAMYVGGGQVVAANDTGTDVQVQSLAYDGTIMGFGRVP